MYLLLFPINLPGIVICGLAFGLAIGLGHLTGVSDEGPLMIIAGPLCAALDLSYRMRRPESEWFHPGAGGSIFSIPVCLFGIIWLVLGVIYTIQGHA